MTVENAIDTMLLTGRAYATAFVAFGLIVDGPYRVARGLFGIVTTRNALLTDYFGIGGVGAGCVNAGLLTLCACFVFRLAQVKITGASVACLFPVLGFGLFGKNLLNIWSIVLGVFLYAKFNGEPFSPARYFFIGRLRLTWRETTYRQKNGGGMPAPVISSRATAQNSRTFALTWAVSLPSTL